MGLSTAPFLAKSTIPAAWEGTLAYGFRPITVAGPRAIRTAFPAALACKLKYECKARVRLSQLQSRNVCDAGASEFSNWACAFRLTRGDLPGNLLVCRARSRRCPSIF